VTEIRAVQGESFDVALEGVPGSGFRWELELPRGASPVLLAGEEVDRPDPSRVGGSATQRFRFEAVEPGELELRFFYRRPWGSDPPLDEKTLAVVVTAH
jgi:inhibitor of cysteine peptidase